MGREGTERSGVSRLPQPIRRTARLLAIPLLLTGCSFGDTNIKVVTNPGDVEVNVGIHSTSSISPDGTKIEAFPRSTSVVPQIFNCYFEQPEISGKLPSVDQSIQLIDKLDCSNGFGSGSTVVTFTLTNNGNGQTSSNP